MADNIFDQLRGKIEEQQRDLRGPQQDSDSTGQEAELREQLQRIQFFRVNIFPIVRDFMRTVVALQREKIRTAQLDEVISITYPLSSQPETRYGFRLPLQAARNPQILLEQVLLTSAIPNKPAKHYLWAFKVKAIESRVETEIAAFDELARRTHSLEAFGADIDSQSEFKEGELLITVKALVDRAVEACVKDMA